MFSVDENGNVQMTVGDTGSFTVSATGYTFAAEDRALWTMKNTAGEVVFERIFSLDDESLGNGVFLVAFRNADTDHLPIGSYEWDVRYIINPRYSGGRIIDGDQVITPKTAQKLTLISAVGEV